MRLLSSTTLVALLSVVTVHVASQVRDVTLERVVGREPLEGKQVRCILQDHFGYLWVGTEQGLNRYDGYGFICYKHDPNVEGSLSHPNVLSLCEDHEGILWVGTRAGLDRFDRRRQTFTHFVPNPGATGDWSNVVAGVREDSMGVLWIAGAGVRTFDRSTGKFSLLHFDGADPETGPYRMYHSTLEDRSGNVWIVSYYGLDNYDREKKHLRHVWVDERVLRGEQADVWGYYFMQNILQERAGTIWLCTDAGPVAFSSSTGKIKKYVINREQPYNSSAHSLSSMCRDSSGTLWIGVWGGGLLAYDTQVDGFAALPSFNSMVASHGVASLYCDREGIVWIGTTSDGLWKIKRRKRGFTSYTHDPNDPKSLSNNEVNFFYERAPGQISVVTPMGADEFERRTGSFHDSVAWERPYALTGWLRSRDGTVYTGTIEDNFNVIQETPYRRTEISTEDLGFGGYASSFFEDRQGIIWMLTRNAGLCQFNPKTQRFMKLGVARSEDFVTSHMIIEDSLSDGPDGWALWIGTDKGLWHFDARSDRFRQYQHDPRDPSSISSNSINMLFLDHHHTLWVGTDQGLDRMDSKEGRFTCYGEREGLSVRGIVEDLHGHLWISTEGMLSRFDLQTKRFQSYSMDQVIRSIRFYPGSCLRSSTGEMYFGGEGGFVMFRPDSIVDNPHVPPIFLTGLRKGDTAVPLDSSLGESNTIVLSYDNAIFSIEYAALDLVSPGANQYAYKLEGYDTSWNYVGNQQVAQYSKVPPGEYIFRVKGSNNDGIWNETGISVGLSVTPPLWKTTWAYLAYVGLTAAGLYGIRRYQIGRINARHRLEMSQMEAKTLREVDELKSRFFANISHEFRTPLTLIGGPARQLLSGEFTGDPHEQYQVIVRNADRLLGLVNQLLDLSRLEHGGMKLQVRKCDIGQLVRSIGASFESLAVRKRIAYALSIPTHPLFGYVDEDKFEKILTNLVGNSFKFTDRGAVEISVKLTPLTPFSLPGEGGRGGELLVLTVSDTGIGIAPELQQKIFDRFYQVDDMSTRAREGTGLGLALTKEMVELHKGSISVSSVPGKGCSFTVTLPLSRSSYQADEFSLEETSPTGGGPVDVKESTPGEGEITIDLRRRVTKPTSGQPVVLLVEDNPDMRTYVRRCIERLYAIVEAGNGSEGVAYAQEIIPDLIISDVMMPGMSGYELCANLKSDERTRSIPIILLTAKAVPREKIEALGIGADDYLIKPFDPIELKARMQNLLQQRSVERQKREKELVGERERISRDMHDDIGARLTEIGIMTELMKRDIDTPEKMLPQTQKISETVREVISGISEIIWATNPAHDHLDDLLAYIRQYASKYLDQAEIRCLFDFPEEIPPHRLEAEERRNAFLVVKEALNNIVKHSHAKEVRISATVAQERLEIRIRDDGCGFSMDGASSSGNGLRNIAKRMTDVGGTLEIESIPGAGTTLDLALSPRMGKS